MNNMYSSFIQHVLLLNVEKLEALRKHNAYKYLMKLECAVMSCASLNMNVVNVLILSRVDLLSFIYSTHNTLILDGKLIRSR